MDSHNAINSGKHRIDPDCVRCDGPCNKLRSTHDLTIFGRCEHVICSRCMDNAPHENRTIRVPLCCNQNCLRDYNYGSHESLSAESLVQKSTSQEIAAELKQSTSEIYCTCDQKQTQQIRIKPVDIVISSASQPIELDIHAQLNIYASPEDKCKK